MTRELLTGKNLGTTLSAPAQGKNRKWKAMLAGAAMSLLLLPLCSHAQPNMVMHYDDPGIRTIDYIQGMPWGDGYLLGGTIHPTNVAGYNNILTPWGNLGRIRLQVTDQDLNTQGFMTYVEDDELILMGTSGCGTLNLDFTATDSKQTIDGGAIVCGRVRRNNGEMFGCGGPQIDDPYLLKVRIDGSVEWYKRYDQAANFRSVVQDPATKNFIVCGNYKDDALIMGVDDQGNFQWATNNPPNSGQNPPATFSEVAPFVSNGITYYAAVGYEGGEKNMLITVIDANGTHLQDAHLSLGGEYLAAWGVHDANDGQNIVITGLASNTNYAYWARMAIVMKIDPIGLSLSYAKGYGYYLTNTPPAYDHFTTSRGFSIIHGSNAPDNIAVVGHSIITDWRSSSSFWNPYALYLEVDDNGNLVRYTHLDPDVAYSGLGIVNNLNTNYPAFAGFVANIPKSFAIRNNYGVDCGTDMPADVYEINPDITPTQFQNLNITSTDYSIREYPVPISDILACGTPKPGQPTNASTIANTQSAIILSPNPANSILDITATNVELKKITVYDITGRVVMTQEAIGLKTKLDVSQLAAGTYILLAEDKNGKTDRQNFVKE